MRRLAFLFTLALTLALLTGCGTKEEKPAGDVQAVPTSAGKTTTEEAAIGEAAAEKAGDVLLETGDFWYYIRDDGSAELLLYTGNNKDVVIPIELDGHTIMAARSNPFAEKEVSITVAQEHPYLATMNGVLYGKTDRKLICYPEKLEAASYTIPDGILSIGDSAFYKCDSLTSVTIPSSVTSIGYCAFSYCYSLTNVTITDGVTSIGARAFDGCHSLTSVTIPDSMVSIGDNAFGGCYSLNYVTIPDSVTSIGSGAFHSCIKLSSLSVAESNQLYTAQNGILFSKSLDTILCYSAGKTETSYSIPNNVTSIGDGAFSGCINLVSVMIPDSVTSIGNGAFELCTSLSSVRIPNNVTSIGYGLFFECRSLTSVTIPNSVTSIGGNAFFHCISLMDVKIPNSVASIGEGAFGGCSSLTGVTIPDSVTSIGNRAFCWCDSLTNVTIPASVTSIGDDSFENCGNLTLSVPAGSYAETYCIENNLTYKTYDPALGDAPTDWLNGD